MQIFANTEPFGEERADWRAAVQLALLANLHRNPEVRRTPYIPENFLPDLSFERRWVLGERADSPPDPTDQIARIDRAADMLDALNAGR